MAETLRGVTFLLGTNLASPVAAACHERFLGLCLVPSTHNGQINLLYLVGALPLLEQSQFGVSISLVALHLERRGPAPPESGRPSGADFHPGEAPGVPLHPPSLGAS